MPHSSALTTGSSVVANELQNCSYPRDGGIGRRVIMANHGYVGSAIDFSDCINFPGMTAFWNRLQERYCVFTADFGGVSTFGNDTVLSRFDSYMTALPTRFPLAKTDKVMIFGFSMGHCNGARITADRASQVACLGGVVPLCDNNYFREANILSGTSRDAVNKALGLTLGSTNATVPMPHKYDILARAQAGEITAPWMAFNSSGDTLVPPSTVTAFKNALVANNVPATLTTNDTHDHSDFPMQNIMSNADQLALFLSFYETYAK